MYSLMRYTPLTPAATPAERLSVADVLAELPPLRDALALARQELADATGEAARVAAEWQENVAWQRRMGGAAVPADVPAPARVDAARERAAQAAAPVEEWEERQAALLVALRAGLPAEEAAVAREREAVAADARALEERAGRLRELTAPLAEFEGYTTRDGRLTDGRLYGAQLLIGRTDELRGQLAAAAQGLARRRQRLAGARHELATLERAVAAAAQGAAGA